ncbi:uncharacterized protein KGF55_000541 [Candida pseudojiufengensis]|uniref:uncharacterized protein n=1 Tax=Candida pseudojiufengensis TaxID=497109 RepID=UPI00222547C5|nr:uncharacterized protein KGF55_000541 [Candida pseudojiufengensis]KAI5966232.1 hypothetical protein KGF55_000541 [Candida pseudojiufengensis]
MASYTMPGSFDSNITQQSNTLLGKKAGATEIVSENLQQELQQKFISSNIIHKKTKFQHDLLQNLSSLCYILIFYQFSKYCHLACLIPFILNIVPLLGLNPKILLSGNQSILEIVFENEENAEERLNYLKSRLPKLCYMLYIKTIFVILYHVIFICTWVVSLVDEDKLSKLEYGTWWFVSFIGESTPDLNQSDSFWLKILKLGLMQIVIIDLVVLFIQLILFQSVFHQSSLLGGRRIEEDEAFLIRSANSSANGVQADDSLIEDDDGIVLALIIRLYDTFDLKNMLY